jgi:hypothetical protein
MVISLFFSSLIRGLKAFIEVLSPRFRASNYKIILINLTAVEDTDFRFLKPSLRVIEEPEVLRTVTL